MLLVAPQVQDRCYNGLGSTLAGTFAVATRVPDLAYFP
jgi:hypothetical protein